MTTKAEKLARELIALGEKYSDRDFVRAREMLLSGELFQQTLAAAAAVGKIDKRRSTPSRSTPAREKKVRQDTISDLGESFDLLQNLNPSDSELLIRFANKVLRREILHTRSSIQNFASLIDLTITDWPKSRHLLVNSLIRKLSLMSPDMRERYVAQAEKSAAGSSSLKQWSDLIVKKESD